MSLLSYDPLPLEGAKVDSALKALVDDFDAKTDEAKSANEKLVAAQQQLDAAKAAADAAKDRFSTAQKTLQEAIVAVNV